MQLKRALLLLMIVCFIVSGCTTTEIIGSWSAPEAEEKQYNSLMVAGLTRNILPREEVEQEVVEALKQKDVFAAHSLNILSPNMDLTKTQVQDSVVKIVEAQEFDALLTVALLDKETEAHYVPGSVYEPVVGYPYYGRFWGYYTYSYGTVYDPGYYTLENSYYMEANLYDSQTEKIIWSAQTRSHDPGSLSKMADDFAKVISDELKEENLLMETN